MKLLVSVFISALVVGPMLVTAQGLGKGSLYGPFDALHQDIKSKMDNLPRHFVVSTKPVDVPQVCIDHSTGWGVDDPNTGITCNGLEAMEVQYDDCSEPWTLCRCQDANHDMDTLIGLVGQIPPASRSYVRSVIATQAPACSGLTFDGDFIRLHGACDAFVLLHEVGHAVDDGYPDWPPFVDAINADSCVPDDYGNTNKVEEFAQMYAYVVSAWFSGSIDMDNTCLQNQYLVIWNDWRIQQALGSPTCLLDKKPALFAPNSAKFASSFKSDATTPVNVTMPSGLKSIHEAAHFFR